MDKNILKLKFQNEDIVVISATQKGSSFILNPPKFKTAVTLAIDDVRSGRIENSDIEKMISVSDTKTVYFRNGAILTIPYYITPNDYLETLLQVSTNKED